jgi:hypothetical protein
MLSIPYSEGLPVAELRESAAQYLESLLRQLPEKRLRAVSVLMVLGIWAGHSPLITHMARGVRDGSRYILDMARRIYRFVWNRRLSSSQLQQGLYAIGQATVARYGAPELVVAIDPVNFEKPYTHDLEGISTVHKSCPPDRKGKARLARGYPALTACVVNLPEPVLTYAQWFAYTREFLSENAELRQAITTTRQLYPAHPLCFVADSGLDDQKLFAHIRQAQASFIIRVQHEDRLVDVWNSHTHRFERTTLGALMADGPTLLKLETTFTHARQTRTVHVALSWFTVYLPDEPDPLGLLTVHDPDLNREIGLLTNRLIQTTADAEAVFVTWRCRPAIEPTYRLDQEAGVDVEDLRVQTLEHMRRVFFMVLAAAALLYHLDHTWQPEALHWLRCLGGKLGQLSDLDGLYLLLDGIAAVLSTTATLAFVRANLFPRPKGTYG